MKNVYEVLRQKDLEVSRLEKEVEALRVAAPLLSEGRGRNTVVRKETQCKTSASRFLVLFALRLTRLAGDPY
jgi:hypothetical protein